MPAAPTPARASFGALLRELRTAANLIQADLGRALHVTPDAVATYERGRSLPEQAAAEHLDRLLNADGALTAAWHAARADTPPDSRTVGPPGALSAANVLSRSARDAAEFGAWAEQLNTGEVAITALDIRVRELAASALTAPPAEVVGPAADLGREAFALLRGHHKPAHARDLYVIAGTVSALLAWLSGDLGALDAAKVHGSAAAVCAQHADQPQLTAWTAVARSKTAYWCGDYAAAAQHAQQGLAAGAPGTAGVMLACQQADAYAKLGALDLVQDALNLAETQAEHQRGGDAAGGLLSCGPARHANYAATARIALRDPAGALADAERALAEFERGGYGFGTVAQVHLCRMFAHAAAGDLEAAAIAARPVLELPPERRLATLTGRLRPWIAALDRPALRTSRVAAPLREQVAQFCGAPGQRALTAGNGEARA